MLESLKTYPHRWALAAFLAVLGVIAWTDVRPAIQNWGNAPGEIGALRAAVQTVPAQVVGMALPVIQTEVRHATDRLVDEVHGAQVEVLGPDGQFTALRNDTREIATMLSGQIGGVVEIAAGLRSDLQPAIGNVTEASKELPGALRDGRFLLARSARTVGHVEQMTDRIEAAVPRILGVVEQTGANVQLATDESAATARQSRIFMGHLSEATKPLPAWARIGLAVAPPMVQTGFTVGSWLALRGKSR